MNSAESPLESLDEAIDGEIYSLEVERTPAKARLDAWLQDQFPEWSRGMIRRWIEADAIRVDDQTTKPSHTLRVGQKVIIIPPPPSTMDLTPEPMELQILFEDEALLVLNKSPGCVVHPAAGHATGTLVHGVLHHCGGTLSGIGGVARPGVVHRLDQDTSGCLVMAKTDRAHQGLAEQFAQRSIHKQYLAIACGVPKCSEGRIDAPIARHPNNRKTMAIVDHGRRAVTDYQTLQSFGPHASYLSVNLHTGRTHQIRVHLKHLGHPVFGDEVYGSKATHRLSSAIGHSPPRQQLHAWKLGFTHPITGEPIEHVAAPPEDFQVTLESLAQSSQVAVQALRP